MAKKNRKTSKPVKKSGKKAARPAARKPSKPARKAAGSSPVGAMAPGVHKVGTGKGAGAREIGTDLVSLFNAGRPDEVERKWWSPEIVSVEGMGMAWSGKKAVEEKNAEWYKANEILGGSAEGPYVGAGGFAVKFRIHTRDRASGKEAVMEEVGVYTVQDGKIVREEFMYGG